MPRALLFVFCRAQTCRLSLASTNLIQVQVALRQSDLLTQDLAENAESSLVDIEEAESDLDDV